MRLGGIETNLENQGERRAWETTTNLFVQDFWNNEETHMFSPVHIITVDTVLRSTQREGSSSSPPSMTAPFEESQSDSNSTIPLLIFYRQQIEFAFTEFYDPSRGNLNQSIFFLPFETNSHAYTNLMTSITQNPTQIYFGGIELQQAPSPSPSTSNNREQKIIAITVVVVATSLFGAACYIVYLLKKENESAIVESIPYAPADPSFAGTDRDSSANAGSRGEVMGEDSNHVYGSEQHVPTSSVPVVAPTHIRAESNVSDLSQAKRDDVGGSAYRFGQGDDLEGMVIRPTPMGTGSVGTPNDESEEATPPSPSSIIGTAMPIIMSASSDEMEPGDEDEDDDEEDTADPFQQSMSGFQMEIKDLDD